MRSLLGHTALSRGALTLLVSLMVVVGARAAGERPGLQSVERLVVHYHDGTFELVGRSTVQKVIPPTLEFADSTSKLSGSWFELQTSTGSLLYRRPLTPPNTIYVEHLADSTTGRIERQEATVTDRTFVVTVPLRVDGARVAIYGSTAGAANKTADSQVLGYIQLR